MKKLAKTSFIEALKGNKNRSSVGRPVNKKISGELSDASLLAFYSVEAGRDSLPDQFPILTGCSSNSENSSAIQWRSEYDDTMISVGLIIFSWNTTNGRYDKEEHYMFLNFWPDENENKMLPPGPGATAAGGGGHWRRRRRCDLHRVNIQVRKIIIIMKMTETKEKIVMTKASTNISTTWIFVPLIIVVATKKKKKLDEEMTTMIIFVIFIINPPDRYGRNMTYIKYNQYDDIIGTKTPMQVLAIMVTTSKQ